MFAYPARKMVLACLLLLAVLPILQSISGTSAQDDLDVFTGLWQGIDTDDDGVRMISISDLDDDGEFTIIQQDTFWRSCDGGRGVAEGTATEDEGGVLRSEATIVCFLADDETTEVSLNTNYEYVAESDILLEAATNIEGLPNILHRISSNAPGTTSN